MRGGYGAAGRQESEGYGGVRPPHSAPGVAGKAIAGRRRKLLARWEP